MSNTLKAETRELLYHKALIIRTELIKMLGLSGSGHSGGSLSAVDILASLYFYELNIDPQHPDKQDRDRFVLSKGHAAPALYATLAERGYFPKDLLAGLRKLGSPLQGHPDYLKLAGVDASTGSLGQGFSWAVGMALAAKIDKKAHRVYALLGDGELQEGMVWEAAMAAAHYKLDNLTAIVDNNNLQIDGPLRDVMSVEPILDKFNAFGWAAFVIADGHDFEQIVSALEQARRIKGQPVLLLARTIKGKGCSFMENKVEWHGAAPGPDETERALKELYAQQSAL
ncbi:MAG: transketolase [Syntrophomonadaceae bacterium]|nr:transketolase [Syntrophomonadaceae bacterium]